MARFGIYYLRSLNVRSVRIAGHRIPLDFPPTEEDVLQFELGKILFNDCYRLASYGIGIQKILDVGANVGLFGMAARHFFPAAKIHCYEPNPEINSRLRAHMDELGICVFPEAVGKSDGFVSFQIGMNSLHGRTTNGIGRIKRTGLSEAIERLGDQIDLLKLDCEGAEWDMFEDPMAWSRVRALVMEYHLWARPGETVDSLSKRLEDVGMRVTRVEPSPQGTFGLLWAERAPA